jgi:putative protein kinase ArgK-like GTPase of G3E family
MLRLARARFRPYSGRERGGGVSETAWALVGLIAAMAIVVVVVRRGVSAAEEKRRHSKAPVRPGHEYERHRID